MMTKKIKMTIKMTMIRMIRMMRTIKSIKKRNRKTYMVIKRRKAKSKRTKLFTHRHRYHNLLHKKKAIGSLNLSP